MALFQRTASCRPQSKTSDVATHNWRQGGFGFVSVLLALLIAAALYLG